MTSLCDFMNGALADGTTEVFLSESAETAPSHLDAIGDSARANAVVTRLHAGEFLLWTGDYHNGRQLLGALKRRLDRRRDPARGDDPAQIWRSEREITSLTAQRLGQILVVLEPDGSVDLPRAPDTAEAVQLAWGLSEHRRVVALRTLIGALGAAGWTRKGIEVPGLQGRLYPRYGVFSPTRRAYVDLLAALDIAGKTVLDVGCGTGILSFVLLQRGAARATGTDLDPRAVSCATDNARQLGLADRFAALEADLFPEGAAADWVIFNAPWMPEPPKTRLDRAVFDADGQAVGRFLIGLGAHLDRGGHGALIVSDLPERLGLRGPEEIEQLAADAGLELVGKHHLPARHRRSRDSGDPLHAARAAEQVWLRIWKRRRAAL